MTGPKLASLLALVLSNSIAVAPAPDPDFGPGPVRLCASDFCPPSIPGPVTDWPWSPATGYLQLAATTVRLARPDGSIVWSVALNSTQETDLVAEGDFTGDGVPDFIFDEIRPSSPAQDCAGQALSEGQLVFVDGANGKDSRPLPTLTDICWPAYGYATHQWGVGTAYIGHLLPGRKASQVVGFPYYATTGWVLSFDYRMGWRRAKSTLAYPSTPAFDNVYNANNRTPCTTISGAGHCFATYSHVANGIFIGEGSSDAGLLVLTTNRAVIYRQDFTPTSDYVWVYPEGGGRDYGLLESHVTGDGTMATLIGGCSVAKTHDTMLTGQLSDDPCGLFHHYEWFLLRGQSIVQHSGRFFGWFGTVGRWQDRLEFPFPSAVRLTGHTLWSVFNLYRDGQWRMELLPNPADPDHAIEVAGWYVWGSVTDRSGHVLLAATRTAATSTTDVASYIPPWEFDLLAWRGGGLVSLAHHSAVVPSLVLYPAGPGYHASDGDTFGLVEKDLPYGRALLVESRSGVQSYVSVP